jgi:Ca-activated chloride channel family protein
MNKLNKSRIKFFGIIVFALFFCFSYSYASRDKKIKVVIETDRSVLPAGDFKNAVIKITLDAPLSYDSDKRPPVNLSIVMDRSGSMTGAKLDKAKKAAIEALKRLGSNDVFSVVAYDTSVNTVIPAAMGGYTEYAKSKISSIQAGGNTALFGGVSQAAAEIRKNLNERFIHRIILLSDGLANVGPNTPEDLGRLGTALLKESISVTTIGVGTDYNEDLMTGLSQKSDGNTYFVESAKDLPSIFSAELGDAFSVAAKKVAVKISLPENVKPVSIIGREGKLTDSGVEIFMNQLYAGQEKYILLEVEISGTKDNSSLDIASAEVEYLEPLSNEKIKIRKTGQAYFSKNKDKVNASENVNVLREYHLNINALAQEKAISLSDKGKTKEAAKELKSSADNLMDFGRKYNDREVMDEALKLEQKAESLEEDGMSKKLRKVLRTNSYQMKNQQTEKE